MLKVKKLVAIVLTVAMLSTLCVFADAAETTTATTAKTITLFEKNFDDRSVTEITMADAAPAAFYVENGTATTPQISGTNYGLSNSGTWFVCMGMNQLFNTGRITFEYSFNKESSWKTQLWVRNHIGAGNRYNTDDGFKLGEKCAIVGSVGAASGEVGTHMCGFNDNMSYSANDAYQYGGGRPQALVDGMNDVRLEIDYDENYIKLFLNDNSTPVIESAVTGTKLEPGVGGFMLVGKPGSVFDDISIKWTTDHIDYYDNNFDAGPTTAATAQYTGVKFGWENADNTRTTATHSGATGVNAGSYSATWYAMLTLPELVNTGVLTYSFDFVQKNSSNATWVYLAKSLPTAATTTAFTNATTYYDIAIKENWIFGPKNDFAAWGDDGNKKTISNDEIHTLKQVVDYDAGKIYTYIDNELLPNGEKTITPDKGIGGIQLAFSKELIFFDNFKVEWDAEKEAIGPEPDTGENPDPGTEETPDPGTGDNPDSGENPDPEPSSSEKIYYKNNFNDGPATTATAQLEGVKFGFENGTHQKAEFDGEAGVDAGGYSNTWYAMVTLPEVVNTGVLTYSFDFVQNYGESATWVRFANTVPTNATTGAFSNTDRLDTIAVNKDYMFGPANDFALYGDSTNKKTIANDEIYNVKQIVDYNRGKVYTYVNGVLLTDGEKTITSAKGIGGIQFAFSKNVVFFDDLEISWSEKGVLNVENIYADGNKIVLQLSDNVTSDSFSENGFGVTNVITGEKYNVNAKRKGSKVELSGDDLTISEGDVYAINLPELEGLLGGELKESSCILSNASGKYLTNLVLTDCYGATNDYDLSNVSPYTKDIKLSFTDNATATGASIGILKENVPVDFVKTVTGKDASVKLDKYMLGGGNYTINITGIDRDYTINFTTAAGGAEIVKCVFKNNSGATITDLSGASLVDAVMTIVKTVPGAKTYKASYVLFNNTVLSGYDRTDVSFTETQDEVTCTFENISIADNNNAMLKIFMSNSPTDIMALGNVYLISNNYAKVTDNQTITINGETGKGGEGVAVEVYKGSLADNVNAGTITTPYLNQIVLKDYAVTDENGKYFFEFNIEPENTNLGTGTYSVYTAVGKNAVQSGEVEILSKDDYEEDIDELAGKATLTASDITTYATALGFSDAELSGVNLTSLATILKNTIKEEPLSKTDRKLTANIAKRALFVENLMNDKIADVYNLDLSITQLDDGDIEDWYDEDYVTDNLKIDFTTRLAGKTYTSYSDYKAALAEAFILATVRYPNGNSNAGAVITEFATEIGVDASKGSFTVWAALAGNNYADFSALKTAYDAAAEGQPVIEGGSDGGGSNGGGGSISGVVVEGENVVLNNSTTVPSMPINIFADVNDSHWAKDAIVAMAELDIINGDGNGLFRPDDDIARSEFCKIVVVAFELDTELADIDFKDVATEKWYYPYIRKAYSAGIAKGIGNGLFAPENKITREDMAVMIYNAAVAYGKVFDTQAALKFEDNGMISDYAEEAVAALCDAGAINGYEGNVFMPKATATRAEAAKIIFSLIFN